MFPWEEYVSGRTIQAYMIEHADCCAYLAFLYLGLIKYGPGLADTIFGQIKKDAKGRPAPDPEWLRYSMIVWNLLLSGFSFFATLAIVPPLLASFAKNGVHDTVCRHREELSYTSPAGFWNALFVLSKVPELVDTVFLILQKHKIPPFLHWYHHVSVLIFAFFNYATGNSTMIVFAGMNVMVHTIMYFYFALCAAGLKKQVRPLAPFITAIQILQMVGGSVLTIYSFFVNRSHYALGVTDMSKLPCAVPQSTARFGYLMYLSYLYLFTKMFVSNYLSRPKTPTAVGTANDSAAHVKAA